MLSFFRPKEEKLALKLIQHHADILAKQRKLDQEDPLYTLKRDKLINDNLDIVDTFSVLRDSYLKNGDKFSDPKSFKLKRLAGMPGKVIQADKVIANNYFNEFVGECELSYTKIETLISTAGYKKTTLVTYLDKALEHRHNINAQKKADALQEKYLLNPGFYFDSEAYAILLLLLKNLSLASISQGKLVLTTDQFTYYSDAGIFDPYGCSIILDFAEKNCIDIYIRPQGA